MTAEYISPTFLDSEPSWWQNLHSKFHDWLAQLTKLQKIAGGIYILGFCLSILGWFWLSQSFKAIEKHLSSQLIENKNSQLASSFVPSETVKSSPSSVTASLTQSKITIHLAGAVKKPGIYNLAAESLLADAIKAAGGFSDDVWQDFIDQFINLAEPLTPNQKIWVPKLKQQNLIQNSNPNQLTDALVSSITPNTTESNVLPELIGINVASKTELMSLAGIGEKRADDIIFNRPYANYEELTTKAKVPASIVLVFKDQLKF